MNSLDYFLLIRGFEFLETILIIVRISVNSKQLLPPHPSLGLLHYILSQEPSEFQMSHICRNYLQVAKSYPCQSTRQVIVCCCGQYEATPYSTPRIKTKTYFHNISVLRNQNSHYPPIKIKILELFLYPFQVALYCYMCSAEIIVLSVQFPPWGGGHKRFGFPCLV